MFPTRNNNALSEQKNQTPPAADCFWVGGSFGHRISIVPEIATAPAVTRRIDRVWSTFVASEECRRQKVSLAHQDLSERDFF
jgi:hypothetical protein